MSITVNQAMMPVVGAVKYNKRGKPYGVGRFVKSEKYQAYHARCLEWQIKYHRALESLKSEILQRRKQLWKEERRALYLKLEIYAVFPAQKLISSDGHVERLDSDNRIKPAKDILFKILNLDDKFVFSDFIEKISGDSEYMIIKITEQTPRSVSDIKLHLGLK